MTVEDKQGFHHEIKALQLLLTFEYRPTRIPLELNAYGQALVASASFDLEESRVTYAIVETPGKAPTFGVSFRAKDGSGVIPTAVLGPMGHIDILLPRRSLTTSLKLQRTS